MAAPRHFRKTLIAHVGKIDGIGQSHQTLVGADIGCCLATADVLFTRLQGQNETIFTFHVFGAANNAPWHLAHVGHFCRHKANVWTTSRQRQTQRLPVAHGNVGTFSPMARWRKRQGLKD